MKIATLPTPNPRLRTSSDSVWPLRCADGRTWVERKADQAKQTENRA